MGKVLSTLKDLAQRAGRWLGAGQSAIRATTTVVADRFDAMAWHEILDQSVALQDLAEDLNQTFDYTTDLLQDIFLAAYKVTPQLRERTAMDPSRLVNHEVVTAMAASPELTELRRETVGDIYAAAIAVLTQADELRRLLQYTQQAQDQADRAAKTRQEADQAAAAVGSAMQDAHEAADQQQGTVPAEITAAVETAIATAEEAERAAAQAADEAEQALAATAPGIRAEVRRLLGKAADAAREEATQMRAWGVERGQLERMSFEQRAALVERLNTGRLGRFADLIGRFRQMATGERARKVEHAPGELVGVDLGDDLSRLVPAETVALGVPALRAVFAARFAEARLMLYDSRGETETGQGAIIACVDCSYSMKETHGRDPDSPTREAWAKACALALLDQARHAKRDFVGILFSSATEVEVFRFPADQPAALGAILDFAEHFFGGGTDYQAPLSQAVVLLREQYNADGRARGDIVIITDAECHVSEDWMRGWQEAKHELGFRAFGVAIAAPRAAAPGSVLDSVCDNLRGIEDLADTRAAADLYRVI